MNEDVKVEQSAPARVYSSRMTEFLRSRRGKMFGIAEVAALAGSCLVFVLVLLSYLYFLVPARSRVASLQADKAQTLTNLQTLDKVVGTELNSKQHVDQVAASLNKFETDFLLRPDQGRMDLYE
jgi:hypothetical protein